MIMNVILTGKQEPFFEQFGREDHRFLLQSHIATKFVSSNRLRIDISL